MERIKKLKRLREQYSNIVEATGDFNPEDEEVISDIKEDYRKVIRCENLIQRYRQNKSRREQNSNNIVDRLHNGEKIVLRGY